MVIDITKKAPFSYIIRAYENRFLLWKVDKRTHEMECLQEFDSLEHLPSGYGEELIAAGNELFREVAEIVENYLEIF